LAIDYPLQLANQLILAGLPSPTFEPTFYPARKWRFDLCWQQFFIAVEIDGAIWKTINKKTGELSTGRHNQPKGFIEDCNKLNHAALLGYRVFRFPTEHVRSGQAKRFMLKVFDTL